MKSLLLITLVLFSSLARAYTEDEQDPYTKLRPATTCTTTCSTLSGFQTCNTTCF